MKLKKLGKKLIIPAAVCMMLVGGVIPSFANNCKDHNFEFNFDGFNSVRHTYGREKQDYSSSYMYCRYTSKTGEYFRASVDASLGGGKYVNCSMGHSYRMSAGERTYLINSVKENNHSAASIKAYNFVSFGGGYETGGLWSPDSV